jgi:hypothetical protein
MPCLFVVLMHVSILHPLEVVSPRNKLVNFLNFHPVLDELNLYLVAEIAQWYSSGLLAK